MFLSWSSACRVSLSNAISQSSSEVC
uniref:Uncharacterized protein n=1 Tax=Arundo donax TaxID=35708 RepID=A0A0A9A4D2_ARUDO